MNDKKSINIYAAILALALPLTASAATNFVQHNLVSDIKGVADNTDQYLVGSWGMSASPTSPFWVSNTTSGTSTLYNGVGLPNALVVTIPSSPSGPQGAVGSPTAICQISRSSFITDSWLFVSNWLFSNRTCNNKAIRVNKVAAAVTTCAASTNSLKSILCSFAFASQPSYFSYSI